MQSIVMEGDSGEESAFQIGGASDDESSGSEDAANALDMWELLLQSSTQRERRRNNSDEGSIGDIETNLVRKTFSLLMLYTATALLISWIFYRLDVPFTPFFQLSAVASFFALLAMCFTKRKKKARRISLLIYMTVFLIFLSYMPAVCNCDVIPRTLFLLLTACMLTVMYALLVPSISLHITILLNLVWAVTGHTLLAASSPDVALRTRIETTIVEFMLSLALICYLLLQVRYMFRFKKSYDETQALLHFFIDIPVVIINSVVRCCHRCRYGNV